MNKSEILGSKEGANYFMNSLEFAHLQNEMIEAARGTTGQDAIHAVWISQEHPYANLVRTLEAEIFPEIPEIMKPFENQSVFLALADTRPEQNRIAHAFRLSSIRLAGHDSFPEGDKLGIALIDDIVDSEQRINADAFKQYYADKGVDLTKCVSVETNFRVGEKAESDNDLPVSQLGYIAVFQALESLGLDEEDAGIFAHLNKPAIISLSLVGIKYEPIMGRDDLKTPTVGDESFDSNYRPVYIPATPENVAIFKELVPFAAPEVPFKK